jgi:type I restriction enzyme S subunit
MSHWTNKLPKDWGTETLKESVSNIVDNRGKTCPTADIGIPLIATNCIKEFGLYPVYERLRYVDQKTYNNWFRAHPKPNDILFVNKGTPGGVCLVPDPVPFCIAQDMVALRAHSEKFEWKYLFAALRSGFVRSQIAALNVGTSIPHFKKTDFDRIIIPKPDLKDQKVIGELYFSLNQKIDLNMQMNKTLKEMAMTLYKHWFIDFGPFQNGKFFESELGIIPQGWEVKKLVDITQELRRGISPNYTDGDGVEVVNQRCVRNHEIDFSLTRKHDTNKKNVDGRLIEIGDVLVNSTGVGTLGRIASVIELKRNAVVDSHVTVIRVNTGKILASIFAKLMIHLEPIVEAMGEGSTGQTELSRIALGELKVLVPPLKEQNKIDPHLKRLTDLIANNLDSIQTLTALRDALLPKLISGEVRVKDVEQMVEAAL